MFGFLQVCTQLMLFCNKKNFITDIELPVCKNCKHFIPYDDPKYSDLSKCNKFGSKNIVSGEIKYNYAEHCRRFDDQCGKYGKYYVKQETANTTTVDTPSK